MKKTRRSVTVFLATLAAGSMLSLVAPSAGAQDIPSQQAVTSARSFPKSRHVDADLLAESVATDVDSTSHWGGVENLKVPVSKKRTVKRPKPTASKSEKTTRRATAAQTPSATTQQSAAASRAQVRSQQSKPKETTTTAPATTDTTRAAAAVISYATQYLGIPYVYGGTTPDPGWDCSGFVQYVFSHFGISLPRTSGDQAKVGSAVANLQSARPGDIIANGAHAGIYIGGGRYINAAKPGRGTVIDPVAYFPGSYSIRRVL